MSKLALLFLVFTLFIGSLGLPDSPLCAMQNEFVAAPCAGLDQSEAIFSSAVHVCNCGSVLLPATIMWTAVSLLIFSFGSKNLMPYTAVTIPPTPPPRYN